MVLPEEYKQYLEQHISRLEALGDKFTGTDERIDYVVTQLKRLEQLSLSHSPAGGNGNYHGEKNRANNFWIQITAITGLET